MRVGPTSHRNCWIVLIAQEVVDEPSARVPVAANCHALVHAVRVARYNVVKFIRHTTALRHVRHCSRPVELRNINSLEHYEVKPV